MNSQFKNSNLGFVIYAALIAIILAATGFMLWYMTLGYKVGTYDADTRLGSVYIGGLSEDEVVPRVDSKIDYWYRDDTIVFEIKYQDYSYELDRNYFLYNLDVSTYDIKNGETNQLITYIQEEDLTNIRTEISELSFMQNVIDNINLTEVIREFLHDASLMKSYSSVNIEDFILEMDDEIQMISQSDFTIPVGVQMNDLIANVGKVYPDGRIFVEKKDLFDIVEKMSTELTDQEMTVLASAMLDAILQTNFIINEVHYEPTIDFTRYTIETYPYYGRNTVVNQIIDESFAFYNPNQSGYYFEIEEVDEFNGKLKLYGLPFVSTIQVIKDPIDLGYITQYTTENINQVGYEGKIIKVRRKITDVDGNVTYDEILFEFYPPVKEIIHIG